MRFQEWLKERHPTGFTGADREGSKWKSKQYLSQAKNSRSRRLDLQKRREVDAERSERKSITHPLKGVGL